MSYQITASIVLYNNSIKEVKKAIDSFLNTKLSIKLYLIDNSPEDNLRNIISDKRVEYIYNDKNIGFGAGHNLILKQNDKIGEFHLILNPDIYYKKNVLEILYTYLKENTEIAMLMPKVLYPNGQIQFLPKLLPKPINLFVRRFPFPTSLKKNINDKYILRYADYSKPFFSPIISGCYTLINKKVIQDGFLYDERFFMYFEDFDLSRRVGQKYKTVCYPKVEVYHEYARGSHNNLRLLKIFISSLVK